RVPGRRWGHLRRRRRGHLPGAGRDEAGRARVAEASTPPIARRVRLPGRPGRDAAAVVALLAARRSAAVPAAGCARRPGGARPARPPQPLRAGALPGGQRNASRPVGQLLCDLGHPGRGPRAGGPGLMLPTTFETVAGGRRLRVARLGSGPPLLLLHGYPDNLQVWCELAPRLAESFEVIALDWPGMG